MKKPVHTILCWILAVSLVWLPLSVSAGISLPSVDKNSCHEMNSTMPDHNMPGHKMNSAMTKQATAIDSAMQDSMIKKGCCGHCDNNCVACTGNLSCGQNLHHVSPFIITTQHFSKSLQISQSPIEHIVQYHNQIISPDIRPPVV